ncbi:MAG TPA: universal stress protein [Nitrospira sp.]|nr:universal stress protein [Nitrospira sp.]
MRVVLAVDASPDSRNAAQVIRQLGEPPILDVLNVVDEDALKHAYISPTMPAGYLETYRREVTEVAEQILHEMKTELEPLCRHIRLIADSGDAAESIILTAEESHADLVIVGQRGMTATPSFLLGGVSQKVATYAPCSVLVVKEPMAKLERILVAVDGSEPAHKAVEFLVRCPFKGPVQVTAVTVWPSPRSESWGIPIGTPGRSKLQQVVEEKGQELLRKISKECACEAYRITTELLLGDPAFAILDAAVRCQAQVIVIGSRGMKAIKRFLLGSVSEKVLVHAPCSVLIVR